MISKKLIKNRLNNTPNPMREQDFLDMHIAVEGYLKHLFLVGLRLQDCTYKESVKMIRVSYIKVNSSSFKAAFRLMRCRTSWHQMKSRNNRLKELDSLFGDYTSKVRNIIIHGNYFPYKANELELLYNIDKAFLQELELTISAYFRGKSILNNTPKDFGAGKGTISNITQIDKVLRQSSGQQPLSFTSAQSRYSRL